MGRAFAILLTIITLVSAGIFLAHVWWMPPDVSAHGPEIDSQFTSTFVETGIAFVVSQLLLAFFVWKYADRGDKRKVKFFPGGPRATVITAFLLVGLELLGLELVGVKVWARLYQSPADPNAIHVQVQAEQFGYYFRYPGPDGKFGPIHPEHINASTGNFFGLHRSGDQDAQDDIVAASLVVPVDRQVELVLHSKDVGHSFYVPQLRIQQDFVPGIDIPLHFRATKVGKYQIVCTQLCGLGHYSMKGFIEVLSEENFQKWLQEQSAQ
jgi:cytochrome c oxidase subunit 2